MLISHANVVDERGQRVEHDKVDRAARQSAPAFGYLLMVQGVGHIDDLIAPLEAEYVRLGRLFDQLVINVNTIRVNNES